MNSTRSRPLKTPGDSRYTRRVVSMVNAVNKPYFLKMAHGDIDAFGELARDFFHDTRRVMTGWRCLLESREFGQLSEEIHRCKGGASLFGLERVVAILARFENPAHLEKDGFDLDDFESELSAAEAEVQEIAG